MFETIKVEYEEKVAVIKLNRPPMNPLNSKLFGELEAALDDLCARKEIKVLIITGEGDKAFAAGADVGEMANLSPFEMYFFCKKSRDVLFKLENLELPTIAAVNGYALGGGFELALCCDFRIASENAKFGLPEINLGIIPGGGGTQRLARLAGVAKAKELIYLGEIVDAATAEKMGLVSKVVPAGALLDEAKEMAKKLAGKPLVALKMAKVAINTGVNQDISSALKFETHAFLTAFSSEDRVEGMKAFLEKRKPNFTDR
ncbi:enoyl-CoA hydratase/isomerase family protein [Desulfovirgula thermocuniculi]|uniref:enoyl-CoA hydratase/isomerase family protein n=1 Tax=Desulfovirgula thermocuniculi TaxID=348842 RepID=UPI000410D2A0|nr:enoyl-CoA hydratase-related protein [Desulfovirgula thermocuniculi]